MTREKSVPALANASRPERRPSCPRPYVVMADSTRVPDGRPIPVTPRPIPVTPAEAGVQEAPDAIRGPRPGCRTASGFPLARE